jgi:hypothetical protein
MINLNQGWFNLRHKRRPNACKYARCGFAGPAQGRAVSVLKRKASGGEPTPQGISLLKPTRYQRQISPPTDAGDRIRRPESIAMPDENDPRVQTSVGKRHQPPLAGR